MRCTEDEIETTFDDDTVWLSIVQMAELLQRNKSTIPQHIKNVFSEGELTRNTVVANFATTAADGKTYQRTQGDSLLVLFIRNIFKEGEIEKNQYGQDLPTLFLMEGFTRWVAIT